MTIQELIDELTKLPDKDREIKIGNWHHEGFQVEYLETKYIISVNDEEIHGRNEVYISMASY